MKNSNQLKIHLGAAALLVLTITGCTYDESECSVVEVSYSSDIIPMLDAKCGSCHFSDEPPAGLDLSDYEQVSDSITSNKILNRVQLDLGDDDVMPPYPNTLITDCQIYLFQTWVNQGSLNN